MEKNITQNFIQINNIQVNQKTFENLTEAQKEAIEQIILGGQMNPIKPVLEIVKLEVEKRI